MTRLLLSILILGGTVAFLSCSDSLDGNTGAGGKGGGGGDMTGSDGAFPAGGRGGSAGTGGTGSGWDGSGPSGGTGGGADGTGPFGGTTGTDGTGPLGGRGGTTGVAGRGGAGGTGGPCSVSGCDGAGPTGGRGGTTGAAGRGGTGGTLGPCDGLGYFQQRGWCASTSAAQAVKQIPGNCDYVRVFAGLCNGRYVWTTRYTSLGDPLVCAYDGADILVGARVCTDTPMPAWNCSGAATSPNCLSAGVVPDIQACALTTTCDATGGRGGSGSDGAGPVGGRGGG